MRVLPVALPVVALGCVGGGLFVSAPLAADALFIGGLALSVIAIVLHVVGMRTYDPYKGRRHSAD